MNEHLAKIIALIDARINEPHFEASMERIGFAYITSLTGDEIFNDMTKAEFDNVVKPHFIEQRGITLHYAVVEGHISIKATR